MDDTAYYLSAVTGDKTGSFEIRTTSFSTDKLARLLESESTAITIAPEGALVLERLIKAFRASPPPTVQQKHRRQGWIYYAKGPSGKAPHRVTSIHSAKLLVGRLARIRWVSGSPKFHVVALIREGAFPEATTASFLNAAMHGPRARRITIFKESILESRNRDALRQVRDKMLGQVETYSSAEVATVCDSENINPSQYASDLRRANRIFAVRTGIRDWRYPSFQFDASRNPVVPFPEMKEILANLALDERGWDRLQWFLDPNIALGGRSPLEVWKQNRSKVVKAAQSEQWNARD